MRNLFGLLLVLCFVAVVPAQERVIDKAEYDAAVAKANSHRLRWKGGKYRSTVTTSSKAVGRPQTDWASKMIFEYGNADEARTIHSSTFGDKTRPASETLRMGSWVYSRVDDGTWTKKEYAPPVPPKSTPESPTETLRSIIEYKYLGTASVIGKTVEVYLKTESRTTLNKENGETIESVTKITYWIDADGIAVKHEYASEGRGPRITTQTVVTTLWELDPSISFVVPEIVS